MRGWIFAFFFFSSRRRHTRFSRDWSSDVCSSDLVAPRGHAIVSADYSQVELRIMAHISGDENLLRAFGAGEDIHRATAAEVFGRSLKDVTPEERRYAKVINFGLIYGMSAFGLAQQLGLERATAQAYIASYF